MMSALPEFKNFINITDHIPLPKGIKPNFVKRKSMFIIEKKQLMGLDKIHSSKTALTEKQEKAK